MSKFIRNNRTISGRLHDEMVMMDINQGKYFSLNQSATAIWEKLENPLTIDELCRMLIEEYDIDSDRCYAEVADHLNEMIKLGLVVRAE